MLHGVWPKEHIGQGYQVHMALMLSFMSRLEKENGSSDVEGGDKYVKFAKGKVKEMEKDWL